MSKLKQALRARRMQLVDQEFAPTDESSIIRQQLKDGIEPEWFFNGFLPTPLEPLPDPFFWIQSPDGWRPVIFWDYAFIGNRKMNSEELMRRQLTNCERS